MLRFGEIALEFRLQRRRASQHLGLAGRKVETNDRGDVGGGGDAEHRLSRPRTHAAIVGVAKVERHKLERCEVKLRQAADTVLPVATDDPIRAGEGVAGHPERPRRLREIRFARAKRASVVAVQSVEIPPAAEVGNEIQHPIRRPFRLKHGFVRSAGNHPRGGKRSVRRDIRDPQLGPDPWHVGVTPGQPSEMLTVWGKPWRCIEVVAARKHAPGTTRRQTDIDNGVLNRAAGARMVLAHTDPAGTRHVDDPIGVAVAGTGRCQRNRRGSWHATIQPLVRHVREVHDIVAHHRRAAAVFMNACAHVELFRHNLQRRAARTMLHQHVAALLLRAPLEPVDLRAVELNPREAYQLCDNKVRGDRGEPEAVRPCVLHRWFPWTVG